MSEPPQSQGAASKGGLADLVQPVHVGIWFRLRTYFLTGVVVTAPIGITIYLAWGFIDFVDRNVTPLIPEQYQPQNLLPFSIPGLGVLLMIVVLTLIGFLTANFVGRSLVRLGERMVARMPIIRSVYGALKQLFETVLAQSSRSFRQVVLVEFPRQGTWSIAFLTSEHSGEAGRKVGEDMVLVYMPTAPNPTSGYLLFVPKSGIIYLEMTVEEGMKLVLSGGTVVPADRAAPEADVPPQPVPYGIKL